MSIGDYRVFVTRQGVAHRAMLLRQGGGAEEVVIDAWSTASATVALRELYSRMSKLLGLVKQAGELAGRMDK